MLAETNNLTLRALDYNYYQPLLSVSTPTDPANHVPMLLMYAARTPRTQSWMSKKEVVGLLKFIFEWLYPEGFSDIHDENIAYRKYLATLCRSQIKKLPSRVPTLNFAQIKARVATPAPGPGAPLASHQAATPERIEKQKSMKPPVDFIIITPLEVERDAVLSKLNGWQKLPPSKKDILVHFVANLLVEYPDGEKTQYDVVVVPLANMGQQDASNATADAIRRWRPRFVLLVGIAGGLGSAGVKLGDVLIADQVANYELQKLTEHGATIRWRVNPVNQQLLLAAKNFLGTGWMKKMQVARPSEGEPQRKVGVVCTGDKVIANDLIREYREVWSKETLNKPVS